MIAHATPHSRRIGRTAVLQESAGLQLVPSQHPATRNRSHKGAVLHVVFEPMGYL